MDNMDEEVAVAMVAAGCGGARSGWTGHQQPGASWTHGHDYGHTSGACQLRHANHVATAVSNNTMGGNPKYAERTILPSQAGRVGVTVTPFVQRAQRPWASNAMMQPAAQQRMQPMQPMQPMMQPVQ